jgi:urease accessory protein
LIAEAAVRAEARRGRSSRCTTLRSSPPLTVRESGGVVHLVGSAAGPVGGDDLSLSIGVGEGASLTVRNVAASMVFPGPRGERSTMRVDAEVAGGGVLHWLPQPMVLVRGCDHRAAVSMSLTSTSTVVWREEIVLGRRGEDTGSLLTRFRVDLDGHALLRSDMTLGPAWPGSAGPAGTNGAVCVGVLFVFGQALGCLPTPPEGTRAAVAELSPGATLVTIASDNTLALATLLDALVTPLC